MADEASKVLKAVAEGLPASSLTYCHREFPSSFLGRDLALFLTSRADKSLLQMVSNVTGELERPAGRNSRVQEQIFFFLQKCVDMGVLAAVNLEERRFYPDSYYLIEANRVEPREIDRQLLDTADYLKKHVEVKDRRLRIRSYTAFLGSDAKKLLGKEEAVFERLLQAGLVTCVCEPDFFQFVPRLVHSGYMYVTLSTGGAGFGRKWVVLREGSLLFYYENRKQLHFEIGLTLATVEENVTDSRGENLLGNSNGGGSSNNLLAMADSGAPEWLIMTPNERIHCMTPSPVERQTWIQIIASLCTVVSEENQLIEQAEAIIVSTSFFINSGE